MKQSPKPKASPTRRSLHAKRTPRMLESAQREGVSLDQLPYVSQLLRECSQLGVALGEEQAATILRYLEAILAANQITNLTRISEMNQAVRLHAVDSLAASKELGSAPHGTLLDLGSGGGFPGVPLAVGTGRPAVLLDSVGKKMAAVQTVLESLSLDVAMKTARARAEEHAAISRSTYVAVVARAVAPLPSLVELAAPLLAPSGLFIALKGTPADEEFGAGREVAAIVGLQEVSVRAFVLPDGGESRTIVCYRRRGDPKIRLPRRVGLAQHQPLA